MANIKDVAERAGVSIATVSRVISSPNVVLPKTRDRVLAAVRELSYQPNHTAKSLRTLKTGRIVVSVPDISNPFFSLLIRGAEEAAQAAGYSVLLGDTRHDKEREDQLAAMLLRREADGLVFLGHRLPDALEELLKSKGSRTPVVNGCELVAEPRVSSVSIDNKAAAAEAMMYLYSLHHRRIGVITGPLESPLSRDRLKGVRMAAESNALEDSLTVITGDFSAEAGEKQAINLLSSHHRPTALFCFSDEMAMGAMAAIRQLGLRCPEDVSVMGFDDIRYSRYMMPPLTTVRQPMLELGARAVELLLSILSGTIGEPRAMVLPHEIVVRRSTASLA